MITVRVEDFNAWKAAARRAVLDGVPPEAVAFADPDEAVQTSLLDVPSETKATGTFRISREFLALAETLACHRDPDRWNLLYRLLWRLTHGEPHLLDDHADRDVRQARLFEHDIGRDVHKMHAFVRFRETASGEFVAWHRPWHRIVRRGAPFFARRFGSMRWSILTPDECAYWDTRELRYGPGIPRQSDPPEDETEDLWLAYYASIFNPARVKLKAMTKEMPVWHWATLPEAKLINGLVRDAHSRVGSMVAAQSESARAYMPTGDATLPVLAQAAAQCQGCDLHQWATQAVFGQGPVDAQCMLVGEQPGDHEDRAGVPFTGPAGAVLDDALAIVGLHRDQLYITNAVKHFSFEERGKQRIHKRPRGFQISACRPWLEEEIRAVRPQVIICLGATAARSLLGREVRLLEERGQWLENHWGAQLLVTLHPSAILRGSAEVKEHGFSQLVADLRLAFQKLQSICSKA